jgi:hypothetical protein
MTIRPKDLKKQKLVDMTNPKYDKENLWEMSNLFPKNTGLKHVIWISTLSGRENHSARIKVDYKKELIPMIISDNPEVKGTKTIIPAPILNPIKKWIIINKDLLLNYWNAKGKMDTRDVLNKLKKYEEKDSKPKK